ncbi:MAG: ribose 5-phosphate isomerase B [Acidobacteriia bacterium]|nr:ribose 5-phosphate isomerase B [Terriglobia bacterium]
MKVAIGSDHAGFQLKQKVLAWLREKACEVQDVGTHSEVRCDYPDFAKIVAEKVSRGEVERGILVCGSGIGMSIAANKVVGVRAAECVDAHTAEMSRAHNDANVLCLGGRLIGEDVARKMVEIWLSTPFEGGRHAVRIEKIREIELQYLKGTPV